VKIFGAARPVKSAVWVKEREREMRKKEPARKEEREKERRGIGSFAGELGNKSDRRMERR